MTDKAAEVHALIDRAAASKNSLEALQFSQAAVNAANALCALKIATSETNK
jgi:hypothetical protein